MFVWLFDLYIIYMHHVYMSSYSKYAQTHLFNFLFEVLSFKFFIVCSKNTQMAELFALEPVLILRLQRKGELKLPTAVPCGVFAVRT